MADLDNFKAGKDYHIDIEFQNNKPFYIKGMNNVDWGMKQRMSNIFNPNSGRTVMFAFDHGYFQGSTTGLERLDIILPKLAPYVDSFMGTRGGIKANLSPELAKSISLRVSSGSSMLQDDLSHEIVSVNIEDAIRLNADALVTQVFIGGDGQLSSIDNLSKVINEGNKYSIPTMGVIAVGKDMERTPKYFKLATRIVAEIGASIIKTYDCENLDEVVAACPVPIIIAGGKKLPEKEALEMVEKVLNDGAAGVDMGRNIFQSKHPVEMIQAVNKVVHENYSSKDAYDFYQYLVNKSK